MGGGHGPQAPMVATPCSVVSAICTIMDDINTEHNRKPMGRAAVAHWTKRLTSKLKEQILFYLNSNKKIYLEIFCVI